MPVKTKPAVTVNVVEPLIAPQVAWIVVCPTPTLLARPEAFIVATPEADELQVAVLVRFCVLPSLYVPVAVNCCVLPAVTEGLAGATAIETNAGAVTVSVVEPLIPLRVALIVEVPFPRLFAGF